MVREYFLGRATSEGFKSYIHKLINESGYYTYIIKGGPGTGKSSMMKRIGAKVTSGELYRCSSDPDSLDGVVCHDRKIILVDGTSPHVVEPVYPGAYQRIINLGDCWDSSVLSAYKDEIVIATDENASHHRRVKRQLKALDALSRDIHNLEEECLLKEKADGFILREAARAMPKSDGTGKIEFRQMSAITLKGLMTLDSLKGYERVLIDGDGYGVRDYLLKGLCVQAVQRGYNCVVAESPLFDGCVYETVALPQLRLAYVSVGECSRKINSERFADRELCKARKSRISFDRGAARSLVDEAARSLKIAKESHDRLEGYYIKAMDFGMVEKICTELEREIFG